MFKGIIEEIGSIFIELFKKEEMWLIVFLLTFGGFAVFSLPDITLASMWRIFVHFISLTWWFWLFIFLWLLFEPLLLFWRNEIFKKSLKFALLEIKIPRLIEKSPQAMEQVLSALHVMRGGPDNLSEKYVKGECEIPISFELINYGGETHFFVRAQEKHRNLIEAAFFSYYPDVEIVNVRDYVLNLPANLDELQKQEKNLWGIEMKLDKEEAYPIKTYQSFESSAEEKQFDPISSFLEVLGKLKKEEMAGMQILTIPKNSKWKDKWKKFVEELRKTPANLPQISSEEQIRPMKSPGQTDVLKAVENNLSKPAFDTIVRIIYISPKTMFVDSFVRSGLLGAFNQYTALNLNSILKNLATDTRADVWHWPYVFSKIRSAYQKQRILLNFRGREMPPGVWLWRLITSRLLNPNFLSKSFVMTTEEIATLFHPPTSMVLTTPHIQEVESKKVGPPAGLAIFGDEKEIERFR